MAFSFGNKIITEGLVFYADAANKSSYGGSGATWYDLSINRNDVTLTNSPTFISTYNGGISFVSESNQKFTGSSVITLTTESFAAEIWYAPAINASNQSFIGILSAGDIVGTAGLGRPSTGWGVGFITSYSLRYGAIVTGSGIPATQYIADNAGTLSPGTLYNIVMNRNTDLGRFELYVNRTLQSTLSVPNEYSVLTSIPIRAAIRDPQNTPQSSQANGIYHNIKIYKGKYLTQAEVTQNYNALKGRFGL
jgi:hypothetical protein